MTQREYLEEILSKGLNARIVGIAIDDTDPKDVYAGYILDNGWTVWFDADEEQNRAGFPTFEK